MTSHVKASRNFTSCVLTLVTLVALSARAEDEKARLAREELDRELKQMIGGGHPARVKLEFVPVDDPNYRLEEVAFELDGKPLTAPTTQVLGEEGDHPIWSGDVSPGRHLVKARVTYASAVSVIVSDEGGHKWKVGGDVSFDVQPGIEVQVKIAPTHDATQKDVSRRMRLTLPARPVMLAAVDDGKLPEPPPRVAKVEPDAGPAVVAAAVAPDATPVPVEPPVVAAVPTSPQKSRPEPVQKPALQARAELPPPAPVKLEQPTPAEPSPTPAPPPAQPPAVPNEAPVAANAVDAGAPLATATPPAEEGGAPWAIIGIGAAVVVGVLVVVARRRARPPSLND